MDDRALALTRIDAAGARYLVFKEGRCAALGLHPTTNQVGCTIYEMRPDACRWLERGSGECRSQLAAKWAVREGAFERAADVTDATRGER